VAGNAGGGHGASMGSWTACLVIIAGFIIGGVALIYWNWPVFWVGVGVTVVGCVIARAVNIMDDVTEYGAGASASDPASSVH
jgi:hypothetical protein